MTPEFDYNESQKKFGKSQITALKNKKLSFYFYRLQLNNKNINTMSHHYLKICLQVYTLIVLLHPIGFFLHVKQTHAFYINMENVQRLEKTQQ